MKSRQGRRPYRVETLAAKERIVKKGTKKLPHAQKRLMERTSLDPEILGRVQKKLRSTSLPEGDHHLDVGGGSIVLKQINTKKGKKHVVASVYAPDMKPPGREVGNLLKVGHAIDFIKQAEKEKPKILRMLPMLGALAGGAYGVKNPRIVMSKLRGTLPSAVTGASLGAGVGTLPSAFYEGASAGGELLSKAASVEYRGKTFPGYNQPIASDRANKKKMVLVKRGDKVKLIHFGQKGYKHNYSEAAKKNYLSRSAGIRGKGGKLTANDPFSANYWARRVLWPKGPADGSSKGEKKKEAVVSKAVKARRLAAQFGSDVDPKTLNHLRKARQHGAASDKLTQPKIPSNEHVRELAEKNRGLLSRVLSKKPHPRELIDKREKLIAAARSAQDRLKKTASPEYVPSNSQVLKAALKKYLDRNKSPAYGISTNPSEPLNPEHLNSRQREHLIEYYSKSRSPRMRQKAWQLAQEGQDKLIPSTTSLSDLAVGRRPAMRRR